MKNKPLLCTPIKTSTQKEALRRWRALKGQADLAELWLDEIRDLDLPALLKHRPTRVICRGKRALEAGRLGADYVDVLYPNVILRSAKRRRISRITRDEEILRFAQNDMGCKLILSHHDFKRTPSYDSLLKLALRMRRAGADIVKIACAARSFSDAFTMIFLAEELCGRGILHILIAMGPKGRLSRILTPRLGGTLMFAPLKRLQGTAPGQLTVKELRKAWGLIKSAA